MSMLFSYCCCGDTGECWFGYAATGDTADYGYCQHKFADQLLLVVPRPAYSTTSVALYSGNCAITNPDDFLLTQTASGKDPIVVRYSHYADNSRLYNWKWYDAHATLPSCSEGCWGYDHPRGLNDYECCLDPTSASRCSSSHLAPRSPSGTFTFLSGLQAGVVMGDPIPKLQSNAIVSATRDFGNGYRHFEDISNYGNTPLYADVRYNDILDTWTSVDRKLAQTMWIVLHRTKWWQRYFNSIHPNDCIPADCETGTVASCRTPQYWDYECAGFPIFTWELYNIPNDIVSMDEKESLWTSYNNNLPMDQDILDNVVAYLDKEPRDRGVTADGRPVYTELYSTSGVTGDLYSYAREGGWKMVCYDQDVPEDEFPQWDTNYSATCTSGGDNNCWTAAPIPQPLVCSTLEKCGGVNACNGAPVGSAILSTGCELSSDFGCASDSSIGDCSGVWFGFNQYCDLLPYVGYASPYGACIKNEAFLCVVPDGNSWLLCDELPQAGLDHFVSPIISSAIRNGSSVDVVACGGDGSFQNGNIMCDRVSSPNAKGCTGPADGGYCTGLVAP